MNPITQKGSYREHQRNDTLRCTNGSTHPEHLSLDEEHRQTFMLLLRLCSFVSFTLSPSTSLLPSPSFFSLFLFLSLCSFITHSLSISTYPFISLCLSFSVFLLSLSLPHLMS